MFVDFFDWLCKSLTTIFDVMKRFILFEGFTYYHFCVGLLAVVILFKILKLIMQIEDEEANIQPSGNYITTYDWYAPKHAKTYKPKHAQYQPRHAKKKWSWFR